ncbi:MAG: YegS/Rv2252/BmrU family lipid kinase [Planctomycetes bacterium]|nr:YegS/Rv2252/BmrU family lipid kinase [Planctomycetota bacterium]
MGSNKGHIEFIVNPKSGAILKKRTARKFENYLRDKGWEVLVRRTKSMVHVCELATKAATDAECDIVVVVGGDGTVREVAHGLEGSGKKLMIVPSGTENLLATELGLSDDYRKLVRVFEAGFTRELDLGSANGRCFTSIAGFGFDGDIVKKVSEKRSGHITHLDYVQPILETFRDYDFPTLKVVADDEEIFNARGVVFVGNISRYARGIQILHQADYGDGLLDVCVYKCASKVEFIKHFARTVLKLNAGAEDVIYTQCKKVYINSPSENVRTELDGDPGPSLPVKIELIPQAVSVFVPRAGKAARLGDRIKQMFKQE